MNSKLTSPLIRFKYWRRSDLRNVPAFWDVGTLYPRSAEGRPIHNLDPEEIKENRIYHAVLLMRYIMMVTKATPEEIYFPEDSFLQLTHDELKAVRFIVKAGF